VLVGSIVDGAPETDGCRLQTLVLIVSNADFYTESRLADLECLLPKR